MGFEKSKAQKAKLGNSPFTGFPPQTFSVYFLKMSINVAGVGGVKLNWDLGRAQIEKLTNHI